jgi:hypothetical protein
MTYKGEAHTPGKHILLQMIYEQQNSMLYIREWSDRTPALRTRSGKAGVKRFAPSLSREKIFI